MQCTLAVVAAAPTQHIRLVVANERHDGQDLSFSSSSIVCASMALLAQRVVVKRVDFLGLRNGVAELEDRK